MFKLFFRGIPVLVIGAALLILLGNPGRAYGQETCAYVNDNLPTANTVEGYAVAGRTVTHVAPVATGGNGSAANLHPFFATPFIAIAPGTTHLYASDNGTSDIALFNVNSSNCALTFVADYPSGGASSFGLGIAISHDGKFLYACDCDRQASLVVFPINADGSLGNAVQNLSLPGWLSSLAIAPNGKVMIVTVPSASNQVQSYTINPATGKLTFASEVTTTAAADGVVIDQNSRFVYVGNGGEGGAAAVQVIEIGANASLTYISNTVFNGFNNPAVISGGSNCLLMSPNGKLIFFTDQLTAIVVSLEVDSQTGGLTVISTADDGTAFVDEPSQIAGSASRSLLFTGDYSSQGTPYMGILRTTAAGALKFLGSFPLTPNAESESIAATTF